MNAKNVFHSGEMGNSMLWVVDGRKFMYSSYVATSKKDTFRILVLFVGRAL